MRGLKNSRVGVCFSNHANGQCAAPAPAEGGFHANAKWAQEQPVQC